MKYEHIFNFGLLGAVVIVSILVGYAILSGMFIGMDEFDAYMRFKAERQCENQSWYFKPCENTITCYNQADNWTKETWTPNEIAYCGIV